MNIEVFVHGVPNGQSFWGKAEDLNYIGNFYDQSSSDTVRFLIQTRSIGNNIYCYYQYLVYNNVISYDGRKGSYFGLSVRLDRYCKDFWGVYKVLDTVFRNCVLNCILDNKGGNYKYMVSSFPGEPKKMNSIEDKILNLFNLSFIPACFCRLVGFGGGNNQLPQANIHEVSENEVESAIRKYGKIALSPYYSTGKERKQEQDYNSKLQTIKQQYQNELREISRAKELESNRIKANYDSINNECSRLKKENNDLQSKLARSSDTIEQQKASIATLKNQLEQLKTNRDSIDKLNTLKAPILELAKIFSGRGNVAPPRVSKVSFLKKIKNFLKTTIPFLNSFFLILILFVMLTGRTKNDIAPPNVESQNLSGNSQIEKSDKGTNDDKHEKNSKSKKDTASVVSIDISDYSGKGPLKIGKKYKATAKGASETDHHHWVFEGAEKVSENDKDTVEFIPRESKVVIKYSNDRGEKTERTFDATEN